METGNLTIDAEAAFARARRAARRARIVGLLRRRSAESRRLATLDQALGSVLPQRRRAVGLQSIALTSIVGTAECSKSEAFDGSFSPPRRSRRRWERLWVAGRVGAPLPPISVTRLGERHFVEDGHHRVSVAHALGMAAIDAEVTVLG